MNGSDTKRASHDTASTVMGLLSRTGPEVPPDVADGPAHPPRSSHTANEPTALLPVVHRPAAAAPPTVTARAVIVYEPEPRPRRGLWVFTAVLVALTAGVVLGQTSAYRPVSRSVTTAQTEPLPAQAAVPSPPSQVTAPLGAATSRTVEVAGAATLLQIRSADLGDLLFSATTADGGVLPAVEETARGPRLSVTGAVRELRIGTGADVAVRVRLGKGADTAVLDGTSRRDVRPGAAVSSPGWRSAKDRYDVSARVRMDSVLVHREP